MLHLNSMRRKVYPVARIVLSNSCTVLTDAHILVLSSQVQSHSFTHTLAMFCTSGSSCKNKQKQKLNHLSQRINTGASGLKDGCLAEQPLHGVVSLE